jgi:transposase-like protein
MAMEKLYTIVEIAGYFGVTESTVLRWIKEYQDSKGKKGLRAGKVNGQWRSREAWMKDYARELFADEKKGA